MPMKRVQLQKGLSLQKFNKRYGTEEQCQHAIVAAQLAERLPGSKRGRDAGCGGSDGGSLARPRYKAITDRKAGRPTDGDRPHLDGPNILID